MANKSPLQFTPAVIAYPLLVVFMMYLVFWFEIRFSMDFNHLGVRPRTLEGLRGILFSPFIHSNLEHLFNNTFPMLILSVALFYFYQDYRWRVLIIGALLTGVLTWCIGRPANHIGASGVIYMLTAFLFFKGLLSRQYQLTALALVVVFLYGSLIWSVFPGGDPRISWEGHLSGFIVGAGLALLFKKNPVAKKKYAWEQPDFNPDDDPFIRQFDDFGNFIDPLPRDTALKMDANEENQQVHAATKESGLSVTISEESTESINTTPVTVVYTLINKSGEEE